MRYPRRLARIAALGVIGVTAAGAAAWIGGRDEAGQVAAAENPADRGRTIVLGFDGMDPELTEQWMADGTLPNFARLGREGHFRRCRPPIRRNRRLPGRPLLLGLPRASMNFRFPPPHARPMCPNTRSPSSNPRRPSCARSAISCRWTRASSTAAGRRSSRMSAEREGHRSSVLRVPVTYPADPITSMLSGMGVPDLLGTQGTFTFYTTEPVTGRNCESISVSSSSDCNNRWVSPSCT